MRRQEQLNYGVSHHPFENKYRQPFLGKQKNLSMFNQETNKSFYNAKDKEV